MTKSITVSEALKLYKETKEAWEFSNYINTELYNKFNQIKNHQRLIIIEGISGYLRTVEHITMNIIQQSLRKRKYNEKDE